VEGGNGPSPVNQYPVDAISIDIDNKKLPRLVRLVSAYRTPSDTGVGDTLERLLAKAGGRKFKHLMLLMRLPCGCDDRQIWLNKKWPY
jgi:hypothetical protein